MSAAIKIKRENQSTDISKVIPHLRQGLSYQKHERQSSPLDNDYKVAQLKGLRILNALQHPNKQTTWTPDKV